MLEQVGPYRLVRELGRGGQGVVYLAEDTRLHRPVALKVLTGLGSTSEDSVARFRREAEVASRLDHPGICTIYDAGVHDGLPYIAMRHVDGESLAGWIAERADPPDSSTARARALEAVRLIEAAARATHAAHQAGVVHRDLKPGNIMVTPHGDPILLDFGLARDVSGGTATLTQSGELHGTPHYMSPEQIAPRGAAPDRRTDVYSLGVTLYECLTRRRPFEGPTREGLYHAILTQPPPDPRRFNPAIQRDLKVVLETTLEKDRDRRYQTALDLAEDLRRVREHEPIHARPAGPVLRLSRWIERNRAVTAFLVLVVAGLGFALHLLRRVREEVSAKTAALGERDRTLARSEGLRLIAQSSAAISHNPGLALLLALEGARSIEGGLAQQALWAALDACHERRAVGGMGSPRLLGLPTGGRVAWVLASNGTARRLDLETGATEAVLGGGESSFTHAAVSRDGRRLATVGLRDPLVAELRDTAGGAAPVRCAGHEQPITQLGFSPEGDRLATASYDRTIRLWDAVTGALQGALQGHDGLIRAIEFSPDGRRLLSTGASRTMETVTDTPTGRLRVPGDGTSRLWDVAGVKQVAVLPASGSAQFSPDGRSILTADPLRTPRLWDGETGEEKHALKGSDGPSDRAWFSPDGQRIAVRHTTGALRLWDAASLQRLTLLPADTPGDFTVVAFHPESGVLATPAGTTVRLLGVATGTLETTLCGHEADVSDVRFTPDGRRIVTVSRDGTLRAWSRESARDLVVRRFGSDRKPAPVSLTPDGSVLALGPSMSATFRMLEVATGRPRLGLPGSAVMAREVTLSPRGDAVALLYLDGSARVWEAPGGAPRLRLGPEKGFGFESLSLSPDGARVAAVLHPLRSVTRGQRPAPPEAAPRVRLIDLRTGQVVARWEERGAFACAFTPDGRRVLTLSTESPLTLRSAVTGEPEGLRLETGAVPMRAPAFDRAGARVAILPYDTPRLFDLATGREVARLGTAGAEHAAFSADGSCVVTSHRDQSARVWDAATGREQARLEGHQGPVRCAAFSPDGRRVVTGSEDATARIFDAGTGREEATLRGHRLDVHVVAFAPDGTQVITASRDGTARIWPVDAREAARASCPRELTREESARFEVGLGR